MRHFFALQQIQQQGGGGLAYLSQTVVQCGQGRGTQLPIQGVVHACHSHLLRYGNAAGLQFLQAADGQQVSGAEDAVRVWLLCQQGSGFPASPGDGAAGVRAGVFFGQDRGVGAQSAACKTLPEAADFVPIGGGVGVHQVGWPAASGFCQQGNTVCGALLLVCQYIISV